MSELVTIDVTAGVADVRLNRPDKYNALSPAMFEAIIEAGESLAKDTAVRAVVLSGNGRGFCAGLDFGSFQGMSDRSDASEATGTDSAAGRSSSGANRARSNATGRAYDPATRARARRRPLQIGAP